MKLEYGKRYVLASGEITGPMRPSTIDAFPFQAEVPGYVTPLTWTCNGFQGRLDLQAEQEMVDHTPQPAVCAAPEPKKLIWVPGRTYKMRNGGLVFVTEVGELGSYPIVGFRIYPGEDAEEQANTWAITGKRHLGNVSSAFDIVDYAYEVGDDE